MLNLDTVEQEIIDLEKRDTTFATIERLAWLYIVKEHNDKKQVEEALTGKLRGSEFLTACAIVPIESLLLILDEHFSAVKVLYPKEYNAVLEKIRASK